MKAARLVRGRALAWILPAALLLFAGAAPRAAADGPAVEQFQRTVPLAAGGTFSLSNVNGSVEIEGWDRDEAQIYARKFTTSSGTAEDLRQVGIEVTVTPGGVFVATHYPEGGGVEVNVEFHVRVPARVRLESVGTINGSVAVHNVSGYGSLAAVNGNVTLVRSAGIWSARTTNGNVSMELLSLEDELPAGNIAARPGSQAGSRGSPGTTARVTSRAGLIAQTVNGPVVVALPADAGAELEARTQNGDFSSDLPLLAHSSAAGRT